MRKSRKDKSKRNKIIAGAVLSFIMVSSVILGGFFGIGGNRGKHVLKLNNGKYVFSVKQNNYGSYYYEVHKDNQEFITYSLPGEYVVQSDPGTLETIRIYQNLFVTFDPEDEQIGVIEQIRYDMTKNLPDGKNLIDTTIKESDDYSLQIIDCNTATLPVIFLKSDNTTEITGGEGNCIDVTFSQDPSEIRYLRDTLIFSLWGIEI